MVRGFAQRVDGSSSQWLTQMVMARKTSVSAREANGPGVASKERGFHLDALLPARPVSIVSADGGMG